FKVMEENPRHVRKCVVFDVIQHRSIDIYLGLFCAAGLRVADQYCPTAGARSAHFTIREVFCSQQVAFRLKPNFSGGPAPGGDKAPRSRVPTVMMRPDPTFYPAFQVLHLDSIQTKPQFTLVQLRATG